MRKISGCVFLFAGTLALLYGGQEPETGLHGSRTNSNALSTAAIAGSKQDPAAVDRGEKTFGKYCAGCHGLAANGGPGAPDLIRSVLVLDDEKGILIAPVIREGRPDKGMPKLGLTEPQISDIVAWLHAKTYAAGHRGTYTFQNVATGNARLGETYFKGSGGCAQCHSVTGDLAGIGRRYDAFSLQGRWLHPGDPRHGHGYPAPGQDKSRTTPTVTVTLADGQAISGTLERLDDFNVLLLDSHREFHSFNRQTPTRPEIQVHDPLKAHEELLSKYTDADIHNVTAYLATLK